MPENKINSNTFLLKYFIKLYPGHNNTFYVLQNLFNHKKSLLLRELRLLLLFCGVVV